MTNKMTDDEIHAVLDNVKHGDEVKIVFQCKARADRMYKKYITFDHSLGGPIRDEDGLLPKDLFHVENLGQPLPPEPEVGSFALLNNVMGRRIGIRKGPVNDRWGWLIVGEKNQVTWEIMKSFVKILYNPDGSVNEEWNK